MLESQEQKNERTRFVEMIEQELGHILSPRLRNAFLSVSRANFVPFYYVQEQPGIWKEYRTTEVVYQNRALVTKVNEKKHPSSSSSMPSIMAAMLEALDVPFGSRILEIGTGTGYNAALLAEVVGPGGKVVSIDIDDALVELASIRLREAGYSWVQVDAANGLEGYASAQPYDRIIVTGGYPSIPHPWNAQLVIEGVLVGNLLCSLATPLFRLVKNADGAMKGTCLTTPAFFMSLHSDLSPSLPQMNFTQFEVLPRIEQAQTTIDVVNMLYDPSFGLFLENALPGVERHLRYLGGPSKNVGICFLWKDTLLTFSPLNQEEGITSVQWAIEVRGQEPLWSMIQSSFERWMSQGKPAVDQYVLDVSPEGNYHLLLALPE